MNTTQLVPPAAAPKTNTASSAAPALVQAKAGTFFGPPVAETPFFAPVRPTGVHAKLTIGRADDGFEREADATADRIVSMPAPTSRAATPASAGPPPAIQSKTEEREKKDIHKKEQPTPPLVQLKTEDDDQKLRRKGTETATPAPTASFESGLAASHSGGQPLAAEARQYMEPRFGADFSGVRVHTDAPAVQLTQSIGAQAFAYQNHVYFNAGQYDTGSSGGRHLLAHELTHVVQQGSAVQRQPLAESAAVPQVSSAAPAVQRLFGLDVAGTIDGWLGVVPGWRLLTTLIGYNPVTQRNVARSTVNLLKGFLTLGGPLGALLFNRLQAEGIIDRAAGWIDAQVAALGISLSYIRGLFSQAWDEMGITLGIEGNLAVARRIFGPPISRMIAFGGRLISQVVAWLKETILRPLSARARTFRGFPLITVIIGKDPFTDEVVERSPTNLVRGFMLLMDGGEERFTQMQQSGALAKAFAWFNTETSKRNLTWTRIKGTFLAAWNVLTPEAVLHPIDTITTIAGLFSGLASDVVGFAGAALIQMLELIFEAVMGAGGARILAILKRGRDTFNVIIRDPVTFVGHLVRAGKLGFQQFMAKGLQYLQQGVVGWLLGALEGAGLQLPAQFDLRGVLSLVLQVLGLTYANIRAKLVRATSEAFVARLEQVFDFLKILVTQGPAAAWQKILEYVGNLRDMVLDGIKAWVMRTVVGQAVVRILSMLNPAGAVIQAIMATYNTVMFFIERINQITAVVEAYVDSIAAIAAGNIGAAANRVEQTMGRMVPVIIGFLARLLGLGGISDTIRGLIARIRQPVDTALDRVVDWVVAQGRRLVGAVAGGAPADRVDSALAVAVPIVNRFAGRPVTGVVLVPLLAALRVRYQLSLLEVVPTDQGVWAVRAAASPPKTAPTLALVSGAAGAAAAGSPIVVGQFVENITTSQVERIIMSNATGDPSRRQQSSVPVGSFVTRKADNTVANYQVAEENARWRPSTFSHRSGFVTSGGTSAQFVLKAEHRGGTTIRSTFYRDPTTRPSLASRLAALRVGAPPGTFFSEASATEESAFGYPTHPNGKAIIPMNNYSEDHRPPVAQHWNGGGNATTQSAREAWNGNAGNFKLISNRLNSSLGSGGATYTPAVLIGFRGAGDPA
ncbi:eCIS core domain-containing protein [Hymenobacter terricola]|uniref:eCIS core domain-containing protein n=1 Tax=Hymenobacter terricola TaxID=2819236 RepID=UPI001B31808E|nr:DUF4157 domain-containing protein [Hymenobacter terricola]